MIKTAADQKVSQILVGLIVNPLAGIGGAVGLKGSDGESVVAQALASGAVKRAPLRVVQTLKALQPYKEQIRILTWGGEMGEYEARAAGFEPEVLGCPQTQPSTARDTQNAALSLAQAGVDLCLFAGGDGTARNLCDVLPDNTLVLGIPAGVKIHSGVYAVNAQGAAHIIKKLVTGQWVSVGPGEVRDIDEDAFRDGVVKARYYGELLVPVEHSIYSMSSAAELKLKIWCWMK